MERLKNALLAFSHFENRVIKVAATTVSWVIDKNTTGRNSIKDLDKAEKTIIGTKFEQYFKKEFDILTGPKLDCMIGDIEFDIKCTCGNNWMIPPECYNGACMVCAISDFSIKLGVVQLDESLLNIGLNRDKKKTLNKAGREKILWLVEGKWDG